MKLVTGGGITLSIQTMLKTSAKLLGRFQTI